jgi:hypothetical protein
VNHRLLVPSLVVGQQLGALVEGLADPGDVAVTEDPEAAAEEPVLDPVSFDVLRREEPDERLCGGERRGRHGRVVASSCWSSSSSWPPAISRTSSC